MTAHVQKHPAAAAPAQPSFYKPETAAPYLALVRDHMDSHDAPEWLKTLRYGALTVLEQEGLPTPKLERWKYANLPAALRGLTPQFAATDCAVRDPEEVTDHLSHAYQDAPEWLVSLVVRDPAGHAHYRDMALWHLANAFLTDGVLVDIPAGKSVDRPVEMTVTGHKDTFFCPRQIVRVGAGAMATIIEYHTGEGRFWGNGVTQIVLEEGATLRHYRMQACPVDAVHTQITHITLAEDALYEGFTLTSGAGFSRHQVHAELQGTGGRVVLDGVNLLRGQQLGDSTFLIEHQAPSCESSQAIRTVLDDQAHGVFQGKVHVHRAGQQTDGYQLSNALLLSEGAEMDTKPELEIYADDVKCSHGATTGQVDDEALFYLRSRGIGEKEARALLIEGFMLELIEAIKNENARAACHGKIKEWLRNLK